MSKPQALVWRSTGNSGHARQRQIPGVAVRHFAITVSRAGLVDSDCFVLGCAPDGWQYHVEVVRPQTLCCPEPPIRPLPMSNLAEQIRGVLATKRDLDDIRALLKIHRHSLDMDE